MCVYGVACVAVCTSTTTTTTIGTSALVDDVFMLTPPKIESHFGITRGHIHHVDNAFGFDQRFPYRVPDVQGLYSCSAGCHPAGSVMGAAGHNAAQIVMEDLKS